MTTFQLCSVILYNVWEVGNLIAVEVAWLVIGQSVKCSHEWLTVVFYCSVHEGITIEKRCHLRIFLSTAAVWGQKRPRQRVVCRCEALMAKCRWGRLVYWQLVKYCGREAHRLWAGLPFIWSLMLSTREKYSGWGPGVHKDKHRGLEMEEEAR